MSGWSFPPWPLVPCVWWWLALAGGNIFVRFTYLGISCFQCICVSPCITTSDPLSSNQVFRVTEETSQLRFGGSRSSPSSSFGQFWMDAFFGSKSGFLECIEADESDFGDLEFFPPFLLESRVIINVLGTRRERLAITLQTKWTLSSLHAWSEANVYTSLFSMLSRWFSLPI